MTPTIVLPVMIGASPGTPPLDSSSTFVALPSRMKPSRTRVRLRSRSRYTPAA